MYRGMENEASSFEAMLAALPAVQAEVRAMIAARIAAGEMIAYGDGDRIVASRPPTRDLAARRKEFLEEFAAKSGTANDTERKPIA